MATSAFKSTTKRASIGGSSSEDSSTAGRSRRSRSVSRFSRTIEPDDVPDSNKNVSRELTTQFPEISLDDLALEFFSSSSYENGSNSGVGERKEREGRPVSRREEIGRWASDTASSRSRGRSVSRTPGDVSSSSASASRAKSVSLADAGQRRRRSLSGAPPQISGYENEVNHSRKSSNHANVKTAVRGNSERTLAPATASSDRRLRRSQSHKDLCVPHDGYLLEKHKQDLLTEMLLEDHRALSKVVKDLADSKASAVVEKLSRARKRSSDRNRMLKRLTEGAEKHFEDFISNVEDTDISSLDGERSDGSSTFGGTIRPRDPVIRVAETESPYGSTSSPGKEDGVNLPWLQWEIGHDSPVLTSTRAWSPLAPRALQWNPEKGMVSSNDRSNRSTSSFGSCSPSLFCHPTEKIADRCQNRQFGNNGNSCDELDEYLKLRNKEELLFEMHRERNRINSGRLLLCSVLLS